MHRLAICLFYGFCFSVSSAFAEKPTYDKSNHNLFCPVPDNKLREMSTDRPDKTEGPFTVDPGHYQIEFDIATYTYKRNKRDDTRTNSYTIFAPNLRIGLLDNLEMNLIFTSFNSVKIKDMQTGITTKNQGFDDTVIRLKYNFWGTEGKDKTAFGIIPFVKIPTNQDELGNKFYDGGVLLPLDIKLTDKLGVGVMTGVEYNRADNVDKHAFNFINSASFGYDCTEKLGNFVEIYTERSNEPNSRWIVTADFGTTYTLTDNWQIDAGAYVGLTPEADDITPFVGMSIRF